MMNGWLLLAALVGVAACEQPPGDGGGGGNGGYQYVANSITMPTTLVTAHDCGLNLDGDDGAVPDNQLGKLFALYESRVYPLLSAREGLPRSIATGETLLLFDVDAESLFDRSVSVREFLGGDADVPADPTNNFSGDGELVVRDDLPASALLDGQTAFDRLTTWPGRIVVPIAGLTGEPIVLSLDVGVISAVMTSEQITSGIIAGGLSQAEVEQALLPALADGVENTLGSCAGPPPACCDDRSAGARLLELFDGNGDCAVTPVEIANADLFAGTGLWAPDLDLFDGATFSPNTDGINDTFSLGVCFTAVHAQFTLP